MSSPAARPRANKARNRGWSPSKGKRSDAGRRGDGLEKAIVRLDKSLTRFAALFVKLLLKRREIK